MNWTEKYRPKTIEQIVGQDRFVDDARGWMSKGDMPNLLYYGPAGTGKTTAGIVLAKHFLGEHYDTHFMEINASQDRRLETIRTKVADFASWKGNPEVPFKIMLLDELDGMHRDAQRALKRTMERATSIRFIITCNDPHDIDYPIRSRCANYAFNRLNVTDMCLMLNEICAKENYTVTAEELKVFAESLNGDMRRAINELQASAYSKRNLIDMSKEFISTYQNIFDLINEGECQKALEILLDETYKGKDIKVMTQNLHQIVLDSSEDRRTKFKWLRLLGEMEWRHRMMTPKIIASWFVAQFMNE
jgi:DNA polymerase III delta prime subunit